MTNKQRYQDTFKALHASKERLGKVYFMENKRRKFYVGRVLAAAAIAAALLTVSAFAANAATDGRLFEAITFSINGEVTNLTPQEDGSYTFETKDGVHGAIVATDGAVLQTGDGTVVESFYEIETDSDAPLSIEVEASGVELTEAAGDTPVTYEVREAAE